MAGQVKGITIEFDGNTVKLQTAINKVKSLSYGLDAELKQINNNLKFDPKNTELLATKQELLKKRIEVSKEQLSKFRQQQNQLRAQKVDETSEEWLKVKRHILESEGKLRTFNAQLAKMKWQGVANTGKAIEGAGQKLTNATKWARRFAAGLAGVAVFKGFRRLETLDEIHRQMEALGMSAKESEKAMDDVKDSVDGTRFMLQDMGKVASAALGAGVTKDYKLNDYLTRIADLSQLAGMDVEAMGAIMNKAYSKGTVDARAMFQINQHSIPIYKLLQKQLGVSKDKLQEMGREGKITFDDLMKATEKYKGLAQKMGTETLPGAIRVLTQQFSVIGADFLDGVYGPMKVGVQDLVGRIKDLSKSGYFKEWGKDLGDVVKYFVSYFQDGVESTGLLSDRAEKFVKVLKPLVTTIGNLVEAFANLSPEMQGMLIAFTLFGGPVLTGVGKGVTLFGKLGASISTLGADAKDGVLPMDNFSGALKGLAGIGKFAVSPAGGVVLLAGVISAIGIETYKSYKKMHQFTDEVEKWDDANQETYSSIEDSNQMLDIYKDKLDELMEKEDKSRTDKAKIKSYVNILNGAIGDLNLTYDEEKDKLNKTSEAIDKKIDAYKREALVKAYQSKIDEAADKQVKLLEQERELKEKIAAEDEKYEKIKAQDNSGAVRHTAEKAHDANVADLNAQIDDLHKAQEELDIMSQGYSDSISNLSEKAQSSWSALFDQAAEYGIKIPEEFKRDVEMGLGPDKIPKTLHGLYKAMDPEYKKLVNQAKNNGVKIPKSLKKKINAGKLTPAQAMKEIEKYINAEAEKGTKKVAKTQEKGTKEQAKSIKKGGTKIKKEQKDTVKKASDGTEKDAKSGGKSVGNEWGSGLLAGIAEKVGPIARKAAEAVRKAIAAAKREQKSGSPSKIMREVGHEYGEGYILGINDEQRAAAMAAGNLVGSAVRAATIPARTVLSTGMQGAAASSQSTNNNSITNTFYINGADNADNVADAIARKLQVQMRTE